MLSRMYNTFSIECRGVNDAWHRLCPIMTTMAEKAETRNGIAYQLPGPITITMREPWNRVLEDPVRNCNHIFHIMEAMWMLAGHNDVAFVEQFNHNMLTFSDDGRVFNAAYGHRWRHHWGFDQVEHCIERLRAFPSDRRAVITMWDPTDLLQDTKDMACNMQIMPYIRGGELCMTTTNRSNDLVWGLCGANAVHLSFLHEYIAASLGLPMGCWVHHTNNLHYYEKHKELVSNTKVESNYVWRTFPKRQLLVQDPATFYREVQELVDGKQEGFEEPFLEDTIEPVWASWREWQAGDTDEAIHIASCIECDMWRPAIVGWYNRALQRRKLREQVNS